MNKNGKPVRKCHGCILNLGERCAVYNEPHDKWHHTHCTSFNDKELYNRYLENLTKHPSKKSKEERKVNAKQHQTVEHYQGMKSK